MNEPDNRVPRFRTLDLFGVHDPHAKRPDWDDPLALRVMLVGDFRGEADATPLGDRKTITLDPRGVSATAARDHGLAPFGVHARALSELDSLPRHARELWHAADWLARSGPPIVVEIAHATAADLAFEMNDAPTFLHSWARVLFNDRNHTAMAPRHLLALGFELDPRTGGALLEHLGLQAELHAIPLLVPTSSAWNDTESAEVAAMRRSSWARWVSFCAGEFRTPKGAPAPTTLLVAQRVAAALGATGGGLGLWGRVREPSLLGLSPAQGAQAWERGVLAPVRRDDGSAELVDDATFSSERGTRRSLSWLVLAQRLTREAKRIHFQYWGETIPGGTSAESVASYLESKLRSRLPPELGLSFALERPVWESAPEPSDVLRTQGLLRLDLRLRLSDRGGETITHVEPMRWLFGFG